MTTLRSAHHSRLQGLIGLMALMVGLLAPPGHAGQEDALRQAGALLWGMGDIYWDFGNRHIARGVTPDQVASMARKAAGELASRRDELAELLPRLDPQSRFAGDLSRFVDRWRGKQTFQDDLLRFYQGGELGVALGGLKSQVSDSRRSWKTPFPFFRP